MQRYEIPFAPGPERVIVFDVETTGTDWRRDQIIELCIQRSLADDAASQTWRIRPSVPISPGAQAVHGISMRDLDGCPPFSAYADAFRRVFADAQVVIGYNVRFDIGMLQAEYQRLGQPGVDLSHTRIVDVFRLWQQCEPRSLQHAHRRFVGDSFSAAHSASADVAATGRVLRGMLDAFGLADRDWDSIAGVCEPERASWVGPSRHIRWADAERTVAVFGFGRHGGTPVHALAQSDDRDYLRWILNKDFPPHVREICHQALERAPQEFLRWLQRRFGAPARTAATAAAASA
jgi:DNA polymerase-3 subunit epsilon